MCNENFRVKNNPGTGVMECQQCLANSVRDPGDQAGNNGTETYCGVTTKSAQNAATQRQQDISEATSTRDGNNEQAAESYRGHNGLDAIPFISTTYSGNKVQSGTGRLEVTFTDDIYRLPDWQPDASALLVGGGAPPTGKLCWQPGNIDVKCGQGWHCDDGASDTRALCTANQATWERTPRVDSDCLTLTQALDKTNSYIGTQSGDERAGNLDDWRRRATFAYCNDIPDDGTSESNNNLILAQTGADTTVYFELNECHLMKPDNGYIVDPTTPYESLKNTSVTGGETFCESDSLDPGVSCEFQCKENYVLDRITKCEYDKILRSGTCTAIDIDGKKNQLKPDGTKDTDTGPDSKDDNNGRYNDKEEDYTDGGDDHLEDMSSDTQYSKSGYDATATIGPTANLDEIGDFEHAEDVPMCVFLPPNRIFPDALVQGQEVDSDGDRSDAAYIENHGAKDNSFYSDNEDTPYKHNTATVRVRFNEDALTRDAKASYRYYFIDDTHSSSVHSIYTKNDQNSLTALLQDNEIARVFINATGESNGDGDFFAMDHEEVTVNPNECMYDDSNNADVQKCRPTASIKFWKRYQVVIGAASQCAGPIWEDKEHVFIRAVYTVDCEFELKYAPGLNLKQSGFIELQPGIWVQNRISAQQPTLMMHSDYSKAIVNVAKASATVTHASLNAFTRLELINPTQRTIDDVSGAGDQYRTSDGEKSGNSGHKADQDGGGHTTSATNTAVWDSTSDGSNGKVTKVNDHGTRRRLNQYHHNTGMCRDSHVSTTQISGFNPGEGHDGGNGGDGGQSSVEHDTSACLFRARMVVEQKEETNHPQSSGIMKSTLAGYQLELSMSQYAQFDMNVLATGGLKELEQKSKRPGNFGDLAMFPSLEHQRDPDNDAFGADVRFDICSCNIRYRHDKFGDHGNGVDDTVTSNTEIKQKIGQLGSGFSNKTVNGDTEDRCSYNEELHDFLQRQRTDGRGLVDDDSTTPATHGFIVNDQDAPSSLTHARSTADDFTGGETYVKQFSNPAAGFGGGIGAACTYEAFFPPLINTPFAYIRAWFQFREATHIDQAGYDTSDEGDDKDVNTNRYQWAPGGVSSGASTGTGSGENKHANDAEDTHGWSGNDKAADTHDARRLRSKQIAPTRPTLKAPPNVQHSVHFKFN